MLQNNFFQLEKHVVKYVEGRVTFKPVLFFKFVFVLLIVSR